MAHGLSEHEARAFLEGELERTAASTSFYWESEEIEEAMDLLIDAVARLVAHNNAVYERDVESEVRRRMIGL